MRVALFLSQGTSLADWKRQGILSQEIAVHAESLDHLLIITPDVATVDGLPTVATVLSRPSWMPSSLYAWLSPFVHWRRLREVDWIYGHNGRSLWCPMVSSWIARKPLRLRFGYLWSWDAIQRGVRGWKLWAILWLERIALRRATAVHVAAQWQVTYLREIHGVV